MNNGHKGAITIGDCGYDVSAVRFGDRELSLCNSVLCAVKDLRPTIQLADFPRISVMLPEATGHRDTAS